MALLELRSVRKHFTLGRGRKVHAVDDIDLEVRSQEVLGLVGESGSGKSTLARVITGLHSRDEGSILFDGQPLPRLYRGADFRRLASQMQMIFQDPYSSLNSRMTVSEIVGEGLRLRGVPLTQRQQAAATWLERVGLRPEHLNRYAHEFSGGQRQRIGIARALITEPRFLVCDEPISALDVSVQAQVVNLLGELQENLGLTLLFIAHDLSMVRYISDRMAVMYLGALMEVGPADEVYFKPRHPYTQLLISSNPVADPRQRGRRKVSTGEVGSPVNVPVGCRFADRCPHAMAECRTQTPRLRPVGADHKVACFLY